MNSNLSSASLTPWGWDAGWLATFQSEIGSGAEPGRVISESRGALDVVCGGGVVRATPQGKLRKGSETWPSIGDWVAIERHAGGALLTQVLSRRTCLQRKAAGETEEIQTLACNIDHVFVVTSLNADLNVRKLERFFVAGRESGAHVSLVISKRDLNTSFDLQDLKDRLRPYRFFETSVRTGLGVAELRELLASPPTTAVFLGSSGVGKSSLVNALLNENRQSTGDIREDDDKGRHTTTGRNAFIVPTGGVIIDTPGIRELQLTDATESVSEEFSDIEDLALRCKFTNCTHEKEPGCVIRQSLASGELAQDRYNSYLKLKAEAEARAKRKRKPR